MMNPTKTNKIFKRFQQSNPTPETELIYINGFTLLVAVVLSAQATDKGVNKATTPLFQSVSTPEAMLVLGEERLKHYIKSIGLYKTKAKNIIQLSSLLIERFHSKVPNSREELMTLPGVGRKTANVILNCLYNQPTIAVDTHIHRVSNRIGLVQSNNVINTELQLESNIPKRWKLHSHHWLILHGRYICKARKPLCYQCLIVDLCEYSHKNLNNP